MESEPDTSGTASALPRQLILGCDGTNNTLTGGSRDTNVLKLISQLAPGSNRQLLYYDPGVGAPDQLPPLGLVNELTRRRERVAGLAMGRGIYENIAEAYLFLVDHYQPGDQIYIFGFSRGAFTARCVAGMVNLFGIVRPESKPLILTLIRVYFSTPSPDAPQGSRWGRFVARQAERNRRINDALASETGIASGAASKDDVARYLAGSKKRRRMQSEVADQVRASFTSAHGKTAYVHFVGVWDTVESVGVPPARRVITRDGSTYHKKGFRHIRHALSMDEHRLTFAPRLYWDDDYADGDARTDANARSLRQRWFRGAHSDVGGGYDVNEAGLSDQAYRWMLDEAIGCGLRTHARPPVRKPCVAHDPCHATPWWGVAGLTVRTNVTHTGKDGEARIPVRPEGAAAEAGAQIHSVWNGAARHTEPVFWFALCCLAVFAVLAGMFADAALPASADRGFLASVWQGAQAFDGWQRSYAWGGAAVPALWPAVWAIVADFALIASYSWFLGLYAAWAFTQMSARRNPQDKVSPLFLLGMAPLCAVAADVAENLVTLAVLGLVAAGRMQGAALLAYAMTLANLVKWAALFASLVLVACGVVARTLRFQPVPPSRPAR